MITALSQPDRYARVELGAKMDTEGHDLIVSWRDMARQSRDMAIELDAMCLAEAAATHWADADRFDIAANRRELSRLHLTSEDRKVFGRRQVAPR